MSDELDAWLSPHFKQVCPTCAKPNMSLRHRQKCLAKSEKMIFKQLRKNKRLAEGNPSLSDRLSDWWAGLKKKKV